MKQPSEAMQVLIKQVYKVFSRYPAPHQFKVCMPCCVTPVQERALRQIPLRELPFNLLDVYCQGSLAHGEDSNDIRYLLPRLLEVIAHGQYPGISNEMSLCNVGSVPSERWLLAEREVLGAFARQLVIDLLNDAEEKEQITELDSVLIMFHLAGLDITPLLDAVLDFSGFWAFASLAWLLNMDRSHGHLTSAFAPIQDQDALLDKRINDWITYHCKELSKRAELAIASPANLKKKYEQDYGGKTIGYWIEESLCALYSGLI